MRRGKAGHDQALSEQMLTVNPRMQSRIHGFTVEGELNWRVWDGVIVDLWTVRCAPGAGGHYVSPEHRLFVTLESEGGGHFAIGHPGRGFPVSADVPLSMSFIPAGVAVEGRVSGLSRMKHLDLHFSEAALSRRFGRDFDRARLTEARLQFHDARIFELAKLLAEECANPAPLHDLYGAGLLNALFARLFDISQKPERRRSALSRQQLRQVTEYMEDRCFEAVRLGTLASLAGLSESHFSHAFKASTGVPPYRWMMQARIRKTQELLTAGVGLPEVSAAAGFADQAHFTRVFKSIVGLTPAAWLRDVDATKNLALK
jgi:AraC-like DNA-binding protein